MWCVIISTRHQIFYLFTHLLTPWCRILFEKLIVTHLVKKHPAFLCDPKVHYRVHTSPPLDPILTQLNPVRPIDRYLPKVHLNVIFPPTPRSSQWSLAFGPPNQNHIRIIKSRMMSRAVHVTRTGGKKCLREFS
jgi:hypothetical protein